MNKVCHMKELPLYLYVIMNSYASWNSYIYYTRENFHNEKI